MERTLAIIKPDAVQNGHVDKIIEIMEHNGFYINRRKDAVLYKEQVAQLFGSDENQISFLMSGPVVLLVLSKVDAVQSWLRILGPEDPSVAKIERPTSIHALFGSDRLRNAVHGSSSTQAAGQEIDVLFPAGPVDKLPAREYLLETVMPGLVEALTDMCVQKPGDPYNWLTQWMTKNRPRRGASAAAMFKEPVLKGHVLKCDDFEDIHKLPEPKPHNGVWNWRQAGSSIPVYGVGQCNESGLLFLLQDLKNSGVDKCFWGNLRDEPMVFVNGEPCAARSEDSLNMAVDQLFSIDADELETMDARLKRDVLGFSGIHRGEIGVYHQMAGMTNELRQTKVQEVHTVSETFDWLHSTGKAAEDAAFAAAYGTISIGAPVSCRFNDGVEWFRGIIDADHGDGTYDVILDDGERQEKKPRADIKVVNESDEPSAAPEVAGLPKIHYYRIPITDETPPEEKDFDDMVALMRDFAGAGAKSSMVFNCQMGRGRTTTAMVCASIVWYASRGWTMERIMAVDPDSPNHMQGEWKGVIRLMSMLDDGLEVKALVDQCIDECSHIQNLREAIKDCKDQAGSAPATGERSSAFWLKRGQNYLERYCYLLLFAAYARAACAGGFAQSFSDWMRRHWSLKRVLKQLVLE